MRRPSVSNRKQAAGSMLMVTCPPLAAVVDTLSSAISVASSPGAVQRYGTEPRFSMAVQGRLTRYGPSACSAKLSGRMPSVASVGRFP